MNKYSRHIHERKNIFWNTLGSAMYAANSFLLLIVVSRIFGVKTAGDFGIAFTTAQILYVIGLFGVNIFQMTDYEHKYSFNEYYYLKIFSTALMFILCLLSIIIYSKNLVQTNLIIMLTGYTAIQSFAELYQSVMFQNNRLDLSGKSLFYRNLSALVIFTLSAVMWNDLKLSIVLMICANVFTGYFVTFKASRTFIGVKLFNQNNVKALFLETWPLFFSFLLINIFSNISKYTVNYFFDSEIQGYYNIIYIPVMAINLFSSFIFKPLLKQFSDQLNNKKIKQFYYTLKKQILIIAVLCSLGIIIVYVVGPEILSLLFKVDMMAYRQELSAICVIGFLFAVTTLLYDVLVILRQQRNIMKSCFIATLISLIISVLFTKYYGIDGALFAFGISYIIILLLYMYFTCQTTWRLKCD